MRAELVWTGMQICPKCYEGTYNWQIPGDRCIVIWEVEECFR